MKELPRHLNKPSIYRKYVPRYICSDTLVEQKLPHCLNKPYNYYILNSNSGNMIGRKFHRHLNIYYSIANSGNIIGRKFHCHLNKLPIFIYFHIYDKCASYIL